MRKKTGSTYKKLNQENIKRLGKIEKTNSSFYLKKSRLCSINNPLSQERFVCSISACWFIIRCLNVINESTHENIKCMSIVPTTHAISAPQALCGWHSCGACSNQPLCCYWDTANKTFLTERIADATKAWFLR